jgi:hypothetical protein
VRVAGERNRFGKFSRVELIEQLASFLFSLQSVFVVAGRLSLDPNLLDADGGDRFACFQGNDKRAMLCFVWTALSDGAKGRIYMPNELCDT